MRGKLASVERDTGKSAREQQQESPACGCRIDRPYIGSPENNKRETSLSSPPDRRLLYPKFLTSPVAGGAGVDDTESLSAGQDGRFHTLGNLEQLQLLVPLRDSCTLPGPIEWVDPWNQFIKSGFSQEMKSELHAERQVRWPSMVSLLEPNPQARWRRPARLAEIVHEFGGPNDLI